jgi:hypothetical protein
VLGTGLAAGQPAAEVSRQLGAAAMEVMWTLAASAPAVVLDANFWINDKRLAQRIRALSGCPVEVYCTCPTDVAARRYLARGPGRHQVHAAAHGASLGPEVIARSSRPIGIGEVITVDTTGPVDVTALASAVLARLPAAAPRP